MRNYLNYTDDDVIEGSKQVKSIAGLLRFLGIKPVGGNYANIKRKLQALNVDCSHWTGQAWNRGQRLKDWSTYTKARSSKKHLIKIRGHKCENCKLEKWLDNPIPLEVHHKDKDRTNNDFSNLELNCANCHHLTAGFRNRLAIPLTKEEKLIKSYKYVQDLCECGQTKRIKSKLCRACTDNKRKTSANLIWLNTNQFHWFLWNYSKPYLSQLWKVGLNSIVNECFKRKITGPPNGFWQKHNAGLIIDYQI